MSKVIGNLNEHGLAIGETTFGGNETWCCWPLPLSKGSPEILTQQLNNLKTMMVFYGFLLSSMFSSHCKKLLYIGSPSLSPSLKYIPTFYTQSIPIQILYIQIIVPVLAGCAILRCARRHCMVGLASWTTEISFGSRSRDQRRRGRRF